MLVSRLPEIAEALEPAIKKAELEGAEIVAQAAKLLCPVRTGRLRDSIHAESSLDDRGRPIAWVRAGNHKVFYGHLVEYGSVHTKRGRFIVGPQPFLVPALEASRSEVERITKRSLEEAADA